MEEYAPLLHNPWVPDTIVYSWVAMAIILIPVLLVRWRLKENPSGIQNLLELLVEGIGGLSETIIGKEGERYLPFFGSLFIFILVSNLLGLAPGCVSPTADINTPLALAGVTFILYHFFGIRRHGIGYLKHFCGPFWWLAPLMIPIELISHLARVFSLTIRLFCNMRSKEIMIGILISLFPIILPLPLMFLGGLIICPIQAMIFTILSMIYVSGAVAAEEH